MLKQLFLIILLLFLSTLTFAQEKITLKGLIFKRGTSQRLSKVSIKSKASNALTYSDEWGNFSILATLGDTLIFQKAGLQDFEKIINQPQNLIIYMAAPLLLEEVVVKEKSKKLEQKEILDGFKSKGVFYNGNPPLLVYIFSPLTALNELLGKDANNAKRFGNYIERENAESNVDAHFNIQIIKTSVTIKDAELVEFMYLYRPKPEDVIYRNMYDDMNYIKRSYLTYLSKKN
jgi:hypothetical protein